MEYNLILNTNGYPKAFDKIEIDIKDGLGKRNYIEQRIKETIYAYNNKLKISNIYYENLEEQFKDYQPSVKPQI